MAFPEPSARVFMSLKKRSLEPRRFHWLPQLGAALGIYRDKNHPAAVAEIFESLLSRSKALPVYLPDLHRYLLDYPNAKLNNVETGFYWEKVNFGLKPTLRIVQTIVYRGTAPNEPAYAVAQKQL